MKPIDYMVGVCIYSCKGNQSIGTDNRQTQRKTVAINPRQHSLIIILINININITTTAQTLPIHNTPLNPNLSDFHNATTPPTARRLPPRPRTPQNHQTDAPPPNRILHLRNPPIRLHNFRRGDFLFSGPVVFVEEYTRGYDDGVDV